MKQLVRRTYRWLSAFGIDLAAIPPALRGLGPYRNGRRVLREQAKASEAPFPFGEPRPYLAEAEREGGVATGHYFHQDLLVARRINESNPRRHLDVGSRVDGFVAHVASFRPIEVLDIRPVKAEIPNIIFRQADLMASPPPELMGCADSVSCLHALEHFGLGRYGDPVDHEGHVRGLRNLTSLLEPGGILYLSVPIGPLRIEYNAHRVFSLAYLLTILEPMFNVVRFSYVDDAGELHEDVPLTEQAVSVDYDCTYGCGIFELVKRTGASS